MRTVRSVADLPVVGIKKPEDPPAAEIAKELREATTKTEAAMLANLETMKNMMAQFIHTPISVEVAPPKTITRWKFTCEYDHNDKIINIIAEAQE